MSLVYQKKLAAKLLKTGKTKVWIDPESIDDVSIVVTKNDMRKLIASGKVRAKPRLGISSGRSQIVRLKKQRGLRSGPGSKKGGISIDEEKWMRKVRSQRVFTKLLRKRKIITPTVSRQLYLKVKGNAFENIPQIKNYIKEHELTRR